MTKSALTSSKGSTKCCGGFIYPGRDRLQKRGSGRATMRAKTTTTIIRGTSQEKSKNCDIAIDGFRLET